MSAPSFPNASHVEINGGVVRSSTITDDKGTRPCLTHVGSYRFFVDVVDIQGCRVGMWDGSSYDEAIQNAHLLSLDFGPVRDLIVGGAS